MELQTLTSNEIENRRISSLNSEHALLSYLDRYLECKQRKWNKKAKDFEHFLIEEFRSRFESWQLKGHGLDSGTNAEVFSRLVGNGLMEDFPQHREYDWKNISDRQAKETVTTEQSNGKYHIRIETISNKDLWYFITFDLSLSRPEIAKRKLQIESQKITKIK